MSEDSPIDVEAVESVSEQDKPKPTLTKLAPPLKRYLMGAYPDYSSLRTLFEHFQQIPQEVILMALDSNELVTDGKANLNAAEQGFVASCERKLLWNVQKVSELLESGGITVKRVPQNQTVDVPMGDPVWANLGTIATYFSVTANKVGSWLDELDLRDNNMPTDEAIRGGLATLVEMNAGGKKTRSVAHWNLHLIKAKLVEAGHIIDFSYDEVMRGRGKNSDVEVSGIDKRAQEVFAQWKKLYQVPESRSQSWVFLSKQPTPIIVRVEAMLGRPRFVQDKKYLNLR